MRYDTRQKMTENAQYMISARINYGCDTMSNILHRDQCD